MRDNMMGHIEDLVCCLRAYSEKLNEYIEIINNKTVKYAGTTIVAQIHEHVRLIKYDYDANLRRKIESLLINDGYVTHDGDFGIADSGLEEDNRQLKTDLDDRKRIIEHLQNTLLDEQGKNKRLAVQNQLLETGISQLRLEVKELKTTVNQLSIWFALDLEKERREQLKVIHEHVSEIENKDNEIKALKEEIRALRREPGKSGRPGTEPRPKGGEKEQAVPGHPVAVGNEGRKSAVRPAMPQQRTVARKPSPAIFNFLLPEVEPPFTGSREDMLARLDKAIACVEPVLEYLAGATYGSANAYLSNMRKHADALVKLREEAGAKRLDEDELSEWLTGKYLEKFKRNMFNLVMPGIARGWDKAPDFYRPFLKLVNGALTVSGFYTRDIMPGRAMAEEDYEDMEYVSQPVEDSSKDKIIDYIERLPYYIKYKDMDGDTQKFFYAGKMVVFNANKH